MVYLPRRRGHGFRPGNLFSNLNQQKLMTYAVTGIIALVVFGFIAAFALFAYFGSKLPSPGKLSQVRGASTVFYDRNNKPVYELFEDKNRVPIAFKDISKYLKQGTVAVEDKRFYTHKGISEFGILRAFLSTAMGSTQGGSTITQQLIKNVLLTSERTLPRKIKEAILAIEVERKYTKDQILEMYLNENPYGGTFYGVGSASRGYFGKDPKDLNLAQSAFLAGLPQNPSMYSPFIGEKDLWKGRSKDVLRRMREDKYITKDEEKSAVAQIEKMKFTTPKDSNAIPPHFVFYAKNEVDSKLGDKVLANGAKVRTTVDAGLQKKVQEIVKEDIESLKKAKVGNGAVVVLDTKTGDILAMVGSYDFNNEEYGKFNVAVDGLRQPGSALKPIEYAVAFEKGYTPATVIMDVKTVFPNQGDEDYTPVNYDGKYKGPVQIRFALANSLNVPAVKMLAMTGLRDFLQKGYDMGLSTMSPTQANMDNLGLSASLGGGSATLLELTSAYSVFARGGTYMETRSIQEISDFNDKKIFKQSKPKKKEVLSEEVSFLISHILSDNIARSDAFGTNSLLNIPGKTVAVKTGTTNDKRDNWAVGYTNEVTVGVWVGNNDNSPMDEVIASGTTGASSIWHKVMVEALKDYKDGIMEKPDKVKAVEVDSVLGGLPKDDGSKRSEYFVEGTEPKDVASFYKKLKISKSNGKLASDSEIKSGDYDEKDCIVITEKDPISADGKNRWQEAIDEWIKSQGDDKYKCTTETSDAKSEGLSVSINSPGDKSRVDSNNVEIHARINSGEPIKRIKIFVNGEEKKTIEGNNKEIKETINIPDGAHKIRVQAWNDKEKDAVADIQIGVNKNWDQ